jgi:hypothetical protein
MVTAGLTGKLYLMGFKEYPGFVLLICFVFLLLLAGLLIECS